jgi:methyl-accepting chemotaxis protein
VVDAQSWEKHKQILLKMIDQSVEMCKIIDETADKASRSGKRFMWAMLMFALLAGLGMGLSLTKSITVPLRAGVEMISSLANGHLQQRLRLTRGDEIGQLANAMDRFADDLAANVVGSMKKLSAQQHSRRGDRAGAKTPPPSLNGWRTKT